jgi:hypothetical protein
MLQFSVRMIFLCVHGSNKDMGYNTMWHRIPEDSFCCYSLVINKLTSSSGVFGMVTDSGLSPEIDYYGEDLHGTS